MADIKKFLGVEGIKYLWSKINMQDYPNNETLMAVINAIDETKADKTEIVQSNWNETDETSLAYVKNKTHSREPMITECQTSVLEQLGYTPLNTWPADDYMAVAYNTYIQLPYLYTLLVNGTTTRRYEFSFTITNTYNISRNYFYKGDQIQANAIMLDENNYKCNIVTNGSLVLFFINNLDTLTDEYKDIFAQGGIYLYCSSESVLTSISNIDSMVYNYYHLDIDYISPLPESYIPDSIARISEIPSIEGLATEEYVNNTLSKTILLDQAQELTDEQKTQARSNISADGFNWHTLSAVDPWTNNTHTRILANVDDKPSVEDWDNAINVLSSDGYPVLMYFIEDLSYLFGDMQNGHYESGMLNTLEYFTDDYNACIDGGVLKETDGYVYIAYKHNYAIIIYEILNSTSNTSFVINQCLANGRTNQVIYNYSTKTITSQYIDRYSSYNVPMYHGTENSGKILTIGADGIVTLADDNLFIVTQESTTEYDDLAETIYNANQAGKIVVFQEAENIYQLEYAELEPTHCASFYKVSSDGTISSILITGSTITSSNFSSKNYIDTSIANLVDSAPETLNTLNELATALQENQDLTTTLNQAIGEKATLEDLNNHKNDTEVHITAAEREKWNSTTTTVSNLNQGLTLTDTVTGINYMITIANGKVTLTEVSE